MSNQQSEMKLLLKPYLEQRESWPQSGNALLAQYDDESVVVYMAFKPSIAAFAVEHQHFGGDFKFRHRMT